MKPYRLAALAALLCCTTIHAADDPSVEIAVASVNVNAADGPVSDDIEGAGQSYEVRVDHPISNKGLFSLGYGLNRVDGVGEVGAGAWRLGLSASLNLGDVTTLDGTPPGRVQAYLRGELSSVWQDTLTQEVPVPGGSAMTTEPDTLMVAIERAEQYMSASVGAGVRFYFDAERTIGLGFALEHFSPLNQDVDVEATTRAGAFAIIPAGPSTP